MMVNDMRASVLRKFKRLLHLAKRFGQDPKLAANDLVKYLFLKLRRPSNIPTNPHDLVADIINKFHVSETFVRLYREQGHGPIDWSRSGWQDFFENLPPLQKLSVPYAMSTVIRGRSTLSLLESLSSIRQRNRYLDVGTGYGGFLRAAKEMGFKEVIGIELQPDLVELAKANIHDLQGAQVLTGDFLKGDFSTLKGFDLITCNDVIEHVDDPELAIQKMSKLRNEDGCISFEVPNKDAIPFVKADGHFLIFGITQLSKNDAAEYHSAYTGVDKSYYIFEMGEMYELGWYFEKLSESGLSAFIADTHSIGDIENVPDLMADLMAAFEEWREVTKPGLNKTVAELVTFSIEKYMKNLEFDFNNLSDDASKIQFKNKYLRSFWTIIAKKEAAH